MDSRNKSARDDFTLKLTPSASLPHLLRQSSAACVKSRKRGVVAQLTIRLKGGAGQGAGEKPTPCPSPLRAVDNLANYLSIPQLGVWPGVR